jgi:hypothetical protein
MRRSLLLPILCSLAAAPASASGEILVDQTVAVVGKRILTLREVEADALLEKLLRGKRPAETGGLDSQETTKARQELARRAIVGNYLATTGLLPSELDARVRHLADSIRALFPSQEQMNAYLSQRGVTPSLLAELLKDRAMEDLFLKDQLPLRVRLTDREVRNYYEREKSRRFLDKPFESVEKIARESARRERIDQEFQKWLDEETRRTEILLLPLPGVQATSGK